MLERWRRERWRRGRERERCCWCALSSEGLEGVGRGVEVGTVDEKRGHEGGWVQRERLRRGVLPSALAKT